MESGSSQTGDSRTNETDRLCRGGRSVCGGGGREPISCAIVEAVWEWVVGGYWPSGRRCGCGHIVSRRDSSYQESASVLATIRNPKTCRYRKAAQEAQGQPRDA